MSVFSIIGDSMRVLSEYIVLRPIGKVFYKKEIVIRSLFLFLYFKREKDGAKPNIK